MQHMIHHIKRQSDITREKKKQLSQPSTETTDATKDQNAYTSPWERQPNLPKKEKKKETRWTHSSPILSYHHYLYEMKDERTAFDDLEARSIKGIANWHIFFS